MKRLADITPYPIWKIVLRPTNLIGIKAATQPIKLIIAAIKPPKTGEIGNSPFV